MKWHRWIHCCVSPFCRNKAFWGGVKDEGRMRGGRWIYHRQVAAPLELWIMYCSSIPRKWEIEKKKKEIEFTLTSYTATSTSAALSVCASVSQQWDSISVFKKKKMFVKCIFSPLSRMQRHTDMCTQNSHLHHYLDHVKVGGGLFPFITAVQVRMMEDAVHCCSTCNVFQ